MKRIKTFLCLGLFIVNSGYGAGEIIKVGKKLIPAVKGEIFVSTVEEKRKQLNHFEEEKKRVEEEKNKFLKEVKTEINVVNSQFLITKEALKKDPESDFLNQKSNLLNERYNTLKDIQQLWDHILTPIVEHISVIKLYLEDPDLESLKKELIEKKPSFEYLQNLYQRIHEQEAAVKNLSEEESNISDELENRKQTALTYEKKVEERKKVEDKQNENFGLSEDQQAEIKNLQKLLFENKKQLNELRIEEIEDKLALIKTKSNIAKQKRDLLKEVFRIVNPRVKVSEADVLRAKDELEKNKQKAAEITRKYRQKIDELDVQKERKEKDLEALSKRFNVPLATDLDDWSREPKPTVDSYAALCIVGNTNEQVLFLSTQVKLLQAQLELENKKISKEGSLEEVLADVKESFYKIRAGKFSSDEELIKENKKYDAHKAHIKADISDFKGRKNRAADLLDSQKKALDNIKNIHQSIYEERNTLFRGRNRDYNACLEKLNKAAQLVNLQINELSKLIRTYDEIIDVLNKTLKQIDFINAELGAITIWLRPEQAISWEGVQNIIPNIETFASDLHFYITDFRFRSIFQATRDLFSDLLALLQFLLKLAFILILLYLARIYLPVIAKSLTHVKIRYWGVRTISLLIAAVLDFIATYFFSIAIWVFVLTMLMSSSILDHYPYILFYLISIPYLLYLANRFIFHFVHFNAKYNYVFFSKEFEHRFMLVTSTFVYATIIILFFRQAFILGNYPRSELPAILLAINFIIFQVAAISLIAKEWILSPIPTHTEFWEWIHKQVDRYYYLILILFIAIIVMSNPYVGFGLLVRWVLLRLVYTFVVVVTLAWLHQLFKKIASGLFFYSEGEVVKERFGYAKTWYGFAVIGLFGTFTFFGMIILAKIWGWPEALVQINNFEDFVKLLQEPLIGKDTKTPISVYTLLHIVSFVAGGIIISYSFNRFVLGKISDILLVESGVENTIASISRYLILATAIIAGFQSAELGGMVTYLLGALLAVGFIIKEPLSDFFAYFIILVQRPVKIGDFIRFDNGEIMGVVRKITARNVILRSRNATTIVIPNSQIINKAIYNWNYVRGFIAFDDIKVVISYESDALKAKELFFEILEKSSYVLRNPKPIVRLDNFGQDGYEFTIRGYLSSNYTLDMFDIASDVRLEIIKGCRDQDIKIALPVRIIKSPSEIKVAVKGG